MNPSERPTLPLYSSVSRQAMPRARSQAPNPMDPGHRAEAGSRGPCGGGVGTPFQSAWYALYDIITKEPNRLEVTLALSAASLASATASTARTTAPKLRPQLEVDFLTLEFLKGGLLFIRENTQQLLFHFFPH